MHEPSAHPPAFSHALTVQNGWMHILSGGNGPHACQSIRDMNVHAPIYACLPMRFETDPNQERSVRLDPHLHEPSSLGPARIIGGASYNGLTVTSCENGSRLVYEPSSIQDGSHSGAEDTLAQSVEAASFTEDRVSATAQPVQQGQLGQPNISRTCPCTSHKPHPSLPLAPPLPLPSQLTSARASATSCQTSSSVPPWTRRPSARRAPL